MHVKSVGRNGDQLSPIFIKWQKRGEFEMYFMWKIYIQNSSCHTIDKLKEPFFGSLVQSLRVLNLFVTKNCLFVRPKKVFTFELTRSQISKKYKLRNIDAVISNRTIKYHASIYLVLKCLN